MQSNLNSIWLFISKWFGELGRRLAPANLAEAEHEPRMAQQYIELNRQGVEKMTCWRVVNQVLRESGFRNISPMHFGRGANATSEDARVSMFFEVPMGAQDESVARRILVQYVTTRPGNCAEQLGQLCRKITGALGVG